MAPAWVRHTHPDSREPTYDDGMSELGTYLKARRANVTPEEAGLPRGGTRRVPGLRREEVASLAGLSVDYYTRLEQGREQHPSASVLNALSRALQLGPDAQRYLFAISTPGPKVTRARRQISPTLVKMVNDWTDHPVVVLDPSYNIIADNHLGQALYAGHCHSTNLARLMFLDPDGPTFYREWNKVANTTVASIRSAAAHDPTNADLLALIGELTVQSAEFGKRWAKAEVKEKTSGISLYHHPVVGDLDLSYETLRPNGALELVVKVFRAEKGSVMSEKLSLLGSLAADQPVSSLRVPKS
jgi:transcriptional regulator with XRE-family HTH domain